MSKSNYFSRREILKTLGGLGFGAALAAANPLKGMAQSEPKVSAADNLFSQGAGFYKFKIGSFDCAVVSDGVINLKPTEFFINPLPEIEKALRENFLPVDNITLQINTLIVRTGKNTALFDTGIGKYGGQSGGHLFENLEKAGISPVEITDVFISHTHFDHISGNFNEQKASNFPNAAFHLSQTEWTAATSEKNYLSNAPIPADLKNTLLDSIKQNITPLGSRAKFFKTDEQIIPGISSLTAYGHTPGHSTYLIKSGSESLLYVGDLIHHLIQLWSPPIQMNGNFDIKQATASRQKVLKRVAAEKIPMMAAHFPFPGVGHLRVRDVKRKNFDWIPIEWQWA